MSKAVDTGVLVRPPSDVGTLQSTDRVLVNRAGSSASTTVSSLTSLAVATSNLIILQDQRSSGQNGGTFPSGIWVSRRLNTEVVDDGNDCTLAANLSGFTLQTGTYEIFAFAPAQNVDSHKIRLQNTSDSTTTLDGTSEFSSFNYTTGKSFIIGKFTISSPKTFEIQHRCSVGSADTRGLGQATSFGSTEIYTTVQLKKVL